MVKANLKTTVPGDPRRQRLLEVAMETFLRYGFRKTSMDEVARAAHISRQGLYLHFATKEELFSAAAEHLLDRCLEAAESALSQGETIEHKLIRAFDEWVGRHAGALGGQVADLVEVGEHLLGDIIREREEAFLALITKTLRSSDVFAAYKDAGVSARDLAETLGATAAGLKHLTRSREEFRRRIRVAVRVLCAPVRAER